jgi:hypothetical protein
VSSDLGARNAALKLGGEGAAPLPAPDPPPSPRPQSRRSLRIPTRRRAHWLVASKLASGNVNFVDFADFGDSADSPADCSPAGDSRPADSPPTLPA